jgi:hypothetical protein
MPSSATIAVQVPRAETESVFLQHAVQAALYAYRNDVKNRSNAVSSEVDTARATVQHNGSCD